MSIVAILGAIFAAIVFFLVRMQQATHAARDIADGVKEARGFFRGWAWRRKYDQNPLDTIEDPRELAAVIMVVTAEADGNLTDAERLTITSEMAKAFGASKKQAEELLAQARFVARDHRDPANIYRRLAPKIVKALGAEERRDLVRMVEVVAAADGSPNDTMLRDLKLLAELMTA